MSNQKSIVVLLSFFGKFPWYFELFIRSCRNNPTIKFCVISDNNTALPDLPANVVLNYITKSQFRRLATEKLEFRVSEIRGYKICDFRPSLGYLFPELIKGHEFWGYGDLDIIYGNLRHFLADEFLHSYDVFSFRPEYLTGSFTLFRNSEKMNTLFMESKDYKTVLSQDEYFNFDECHFLFPSLQAGIPIEDIPSKIESMTHVVKRKERDKYLSAHFDFNLLEGSVGNIKWEKGRIIYKNQFEAILYHLLKFKDYYHHENHILPASEHETIHFSKSNIYKRRNK